MSEEYIEEGINGQWTNWKFEAENYKKIYEHLYQENKQLKEVIDEAREKLKLERKIALSLKHPYTVSNIDEVLQILDKVKEI